MRTCLNELAGCFVAYMMPLIANIPPFRVALFSKLPTIHFSSSLTCDALTTCSWCLKLCTGFESFWVSNIDRCKDEAQAGIRGVIPSSRNAPMNPNSLGIAIESDETGLEDVCSSFIRKRCRKSTVISKTIIIVTVIPYELALLPNLPQIRCLSFSRCCPRLCP
jgi:hypothetical protein